jgi:hypothetical protein
MFKVGDKVRCINNDGLKYIEKNKIYKINKISLKYYIWLDGLEYDKNGFPYCRFELVEENSLPELPKLSQMRLESLIGYLNTNYIGAIRITDREKSLILNALSLLGIELTQKQITKIILENPYK